MSLRKLKKRLAIDQRNLLIGTVVSINQGTVRVRTASGEIRTAEGSGYALGQRVQIQTDGTTATVTSAARLVDLGGEVIYEV